MTDQYYNIIMYKNLILIVFIIPFFGCGYESLYSKNKILAFTYPHQSYRNKEINNLIEKELAKYNKKNEKEFSIKNKQQFQ